MDMLLNFHFVRPWWLLTLIPTALLIIYILHQQKTSRAWQKVIAPDFLIHLLEGSANKQSRWPVRLLAFGWLLCVLALAGPAWNKFPEPVFKNQSASVVVLDLSASMYATDSAPNRLTVAKHKLLDLLHERGDGLTALVVYAGDAHIVTPLTDDINTIENMVTSISPDIMPIPGSNAPEAIRMAINLLKQANESHGNIILISDGIDDDQTQKVVSFAKSSGVSISVLGIGTIEGSAITLPNGALVKDNNGAIVTPTLTRSELQSVAKETNGIYVEAQVDDGDINALLANASHANIDNQKASDRFSDAWQEEGAWLVLLILPIAAWCFRKGWLLSILLIIVISPTQHANADIFKTPDQAGSAAFKENQYGSAATLFKNNDWKGASYYRDGKYDKAAEAFAASDTTQSNYNRGNALVQSGDFENAVKAYDRAIELDTSNKDAITNRAITQKLLEQQEKQKQENKDKNQSEDQESDESKKDDSQNFSDQNKKNERQSTDKKSTGKENQQAQEKQESSTSEDNAKQTGSQGQEQPQPQSEKSSAQSTEKSDAVSDDKNTPNQQLTTQPMNESDKNADEANQQSMPNNKSNKEDLPKSKEMTAAEAQKINEEKQALEQWLRKVPDDPAGLLERKFRYQSQQNNSPIDPNKTW
jgi:Ca-activated chloride channel family protein